MFNIRENQIFDLIKEINPNKINYNHSTQIKIIHTIGKWLEIDMYISKPIDLEDKKIARYIHLLKEFLYKPEFFPLFVTYGSHSHIDVDDDMSLVYEIDKYYFVVSLCESEPKRFKYVIQTTERTFLKNKFDILENGKFTGTKKGAEENGEESIFMLDNYEDLKKIVCHNNLNKRALSKCTPSILLKNYTPKTEIKKINYKIFFRNNHFQIECKDGTLGFNLELLLTWSNTVANWVSSMGEDVNELTIPFTKRTLILYALYRLMNIQKMEFDKKIEIHGYQFDFETNKEFMVVYEDLYKMADYLEDFEMLEWVVRYFYLSVNDIYLRQKFLELIKCN